MAISEKKKASNKKYDENNMKRFTLILNNKIYDRMIKAIENMDDINRNKYVTLAIMEKLARDGD